MASLLLPPVRIVLVRTSSPGNVGSVARCMRNMGLTSGLTLVDPTTPSAASAAGRRKPHPKARAMASGAVEVLTSAEVFWTSSCEAGTADAGVPSTGGLERALHGCAFTVGATARVENFDGPVLPVRECAARLLKKARRREREYLGDDGKWQVDDARPAIAVVFGAERGGLFDDELALCDAAMTIPADPAFASLNLAMATQIFTYEWRMAALEMLGRGLP